MAWFSCMHSDFSGIFLYNWDSLLIYFVLIMLSELNFEKSLWNRVNASLISHCVYNIFFSQILQEGVPLHALSHPWQRLCWKWTGNSLIQSLKWTSQIGLRKSPNFCWDEGAPMAVCCLRCFGWLWVFLFLDMSSLCTLWLNFISLTDSMPHFFYCRRSPWKRLKHRLQICNAQAIVYWVARN